MSAPTTMTEALQWALRRLELAKLHDGEYFMAADAILAAAATPPAAIAAEDDDQATRQRIGCDAILEAHQVCYGALRLLHEQREHLTRELDPLKGQLMRLNELAGLTYAGLVGTPDDTPTDEMHLSLYGVERLADAEVRS